MRVMSNVAAFVTLCQKIIADEQANRLDILVAAAKIHRQADEQPFEAIAHPMLYKVEHLAFDIAEDYRSDKDNLADWSMIRTTIDNYVKGDWEPTCWILNASYGEFSGKKLSQSYSLFVRRQNGDSDVEVAIDLIQAAIQKVVGTINKEQTDERYLRNLEVHMPQKVGKYTLLGSEVHEYLTEPYYTTAP